MRRQSPSPRGILQLSCLISLVAAATAKPAGAGFIFTSLDLENSVFDSTGAGEGDADNITTATNPLNQTSIAQVGMNIIESTYAFQWNEGLGTADFNTDVSHAMRSAEIDTVTRIQIFIEPTEPLRVLIDGEIDYAHTPGDDSSLFFAMSIRNFDTFEYAFQERRQGGNLLLLPSSGTFAINGDAILNPGTLYRLQVVLDNDNISEPNPGILDANGFANFSIRPIPEPTAIALLALPTTILIRRRKRRAQSAQQQRTAQPPNFDFFKF